uniref:Cytochrome P450 monooxygenase 91 n=1 Tax=Postia placenta (strain ATCC 44394 / Madison 698-R) TaxID=561896 RepID=CY091_POSPM|nr:RecName: Full=Cytochrome P450 monooxygenase 91; Flags: Precursor [Postia placenta Mad-698-R]BAK09429.1 cytochrome P450 [Postia placenta]
MLDILRFVLICGILWILRRVLLRVFIHSPLDKIPGPPPVSFAKGNLPQLYDRNGWDFIKGLGEKYGGVVKINGLYGAKMLFVFDPAALSSVVVKDQYVYERSEDATKSTRLMLGDGLLTSQGETHRKQRKLMNPVFSINHMRDMMPIFYQISRNLRDAIASRIDNGEKEIDVLDWMARTALELVGQAGLGYSFDPLVQDKADAYAEAIKALVPTAFGLRLYRPLLPIALKIGTPAIRRRILKLIPSTRLQRMREISDAIDAHSKRIFEEKKQALARGDEAVLKQVGAGKDILSRLMQANMTASEEDRLPENELLGQMSTFIFAGMDTTSGALAHTLQLLAEHPDVQDKMRAEIVAALGGGQEIPYDTLVDLPYLDAVCRETLRLYAPVTTVNRTAQEDIVLPLSEPIRGTDGNLIQEIPVPKGTEVIVGILASNRNPALWGPDAAEWKPERWLEPLPDTINTARVPGVYSHLMTFLGGGRACIGFKFSQLEMKVVLAVLLSSFKFSLSSKEIVWNVAGIQYPTVGASGKPEMPMKIDRVKNT